MKLKSTLTIALFSLGAIVAHAQEVKLNIPAPNQPAAPASEAFSETQVLEVVGWFIGKNSQVETFDFTKEQLDAVIRGFLVAAAGKEAPVDLQKVGPQVEAFVEKRQDAYLSKLKQQGMAEAEKFMGDIRKKPGVVALPSGLAYEIVKQGEGATAKPTDTVRAHYTGTLVNGTVFDTSREPRQPGAPIEPAEFPLDQVIPGWTEGLQKVGKGGHIKLYIPPHLAYGDDGRPGIPPASTLIFDVEVIDLKPTPGPASLGR